MLFVYCKNKNVLEIINSFKTFSSSYGMKDNKKINGHPIKVN